MNKSIDNNLLYINLNNPMCSGAFSKICIIYSQLPSQTSNKNKYERFKTNKYYKDKKIFDKYLINSKLVVKLDEISITEYNFMEKYCVLDNNDFLVMLLANVSSIDSYHNGMVIEKAQMDSKTFLSKIEKELDFHLKLQLIELFSLFFEQVLNFLENENLVYGDWKFDNILCFFEIDVDDKTNNYLIYLLKNRNIKIKLTDFGSIMKNNSTIENKNNINIIYGSSSFSNIFKTIYPTFKDDWISVCYMMYEIVEGKQLPWSMMCSDIDNINEIDDIKIEIDNLKTNPLIFLKVNEQLWPNGKHFKFLNILF